MKFTLPTLMGKKGGKFYDTTGCDDKYVCEQNGNGLCKGGSDLN